MMRPLGKRQLSYLEALAMVDTRDDFEDRVWRSLWKRKLVHRSSGSVGSVLVFGRRIKRYRWYLTPEGAAALRTVRDD